MLVPYYGLKKNNTKTYTNNDYVWVDLKVFLNILSPEIIKKFEHINALEDEKWIDKIEEIASSMNMPPVSIGDNFVKFSEFIISAKLLYMTGFTCEYGLWEIGSGKHHGIDLILPAGTPIESFSHGEVVKIKKWDGKTKNEGNTIIIKSVIDNEELYFCYEHLDEIKVKEKDIVKIGDVIGTCGNTGNSTTYHLHFQIDKSVVSFHPYWDKNDTIQTINENCINPWEWLRKNYKKTISKEDSLNLVDELLNSVSKVKNKKSLSEEKVSKTSKKEKTNEIELVNAIMEDIQKENLVNENYLTAFINAGILKGENGQLQLEKPLTRFQITLILYRLFKKGFLSLEGVDLNKKGKITFSDIKQNLLKDYEFKKALEFVLGNNILKGDNGKFYPFAKLTGEQFLAILGRLFVNLKDGKNIWYKPYLDWAKEKGIIPKNWAYIGKAVPRNEVFKILHKIVFNNLV